MNTTATATAEPITVDNIQTFADNGEYSASVYYYRGIALELVRMVSPAKVRKLISDRMKTLNERRRSSHPLHHHYSTDLTELAVLVEVYKTAGIV